MSNPDARWRRAWTVPVLLLIAFLGLALARCSARDTVPGAQPFSAATVGEQDASFSFERTSEARVLFLRGKVTNRTARDLREQAALLKASAGANEPQWEIDDSLEISKNGIAIADPKGAMEAFLLTGAPSALRVNSEYGAQLTGTAPDADSATIFGDAVQAALGSGAIRNSLTLARSAAPAANDPTANEPAAVEPAP